MEKTQVVNRNILLINSALACELCFNVYNPRLGKLIESLRCKAHINCLRFVGDSTDRAKYTELISNLENTNCEQCEKDRATVKCENETCSKYFHLSCITSAQGRINYLSGTITCLQHSTREPSGEGTCSLCSWGTRNQDIVKVSCCGEVLHCSCVQVRISRKELTCPGCSNTKKYQDCIQRSGVYISNTNNEQTFLNNLQDEIKSNGKIFYSNQNGRTAPHSLTQNGGRTTPGGGRSTPGGGRSTPGGGRITPGGGRITPVGGRANPVGKRASLGGGRSTPVGRRASLGGGRNTPAPVDGELTCLGEVITVKDDELGSQGGRKSLKASAPGTNKSLGAAVLVNLVTSDSEDTDDPSWSVLNPERNNKLREPVEQVLIREPELLNLKQKSVREKRRLSESSLNKKLAEKQIKPKPSTPRRTPTRTQGRSKQGKDKPLQTSEEQGEKNPSRYSRGSCQNEFQVWSGTNNLLPEPDDSGYSTKSSSLSPKLSDPSLKLQSESFGPIFNVDNDEKSRLNADKSEVLTPTQSQVQTRSTDPGVNVNRLSCTCGSCIECDIPMLPVLLKPTLTITNYTELNSGNDSEQSVSEIDCETLNRVSRKRRRGSDEENIVPELELKKVCRSRKLKEKWIASPVKLKKIKAEGKMELDDKSYPVSSQISEKEPLLKSRKRKEGVNLDIKLDILDNMETEHSSQSFEVELNNSSECEKSIRQIRKKSSRRVVEDNNSGGRNAPTKTRRKKSTSEPENTVPSPEKSSVIRNPNSKSSANKDFHNIKRDEISEGKDKSTLNSFKNYLDDRLKVKGQRRSLFSSKESDDERSLREEETVRISGSKRRPYLRKELKLTPSTSRIAKPDKELNTTEDEISCSDEEFGRSEKDKNKPKSRKNKVQIIEKKIVLPQSKVVKGKRSKLMKTVKDLKTRMIVHGRNSVPYDQENEEFLPTSYSSVPEIIQRNIADFVDVNPGEKRFMRLWDSFLVDKPFIGFIHLPDIISSFIRLHGATIFSLNLFRNFIMFLSGLEQSGILDSCAFLRLINELQVGVDDPPDLSASSEESLILELSEDEPTSTQSLNPSSSAIKVKNDPIPSSDHKTEKEVISASSGLNLSRRKCALTSIYTEEKHVPSNPLADDQDELLSCLFLPLSDDEFEP